jgi:hypothetical protein
MIFNINTGRITYDVDVDIDGKDINTYQYIMINSILQWVEDDDIQRSSSFMTMKDTQSVTGT